MVETARQSAWRREAMIDVTEQVRSLLEDNEVTIGWAFLTDLTNDEVLDLELVACRILTNPEVDGDCWQRWLSRVRTTLDDRHANLPADDELRYLPLDFCDEPEVCVDPAPQAGIHFHDLGDQDPYAQSGGGR